LRRRSREPGQRPGRTLGKPIAWLAFAVATAVLASPLKLAWARASLGWTFPFVLWLGIIAVSFWTSLRAGGAHGVDPDDD